MNKSTLILISIQTLFFIGTSFISDNQITIKQQIPAIAHSGDEFTVNVKIHKGDATGAGRLQYELPDGYTAFEMSGKGADFIFEDHSVKFIWTKLPEEKDFEINYKINVDEKVSVNGTITGVFVCVNNGKTERFNLPPALIYIQPKDESIAETPKVVKPTENAPGITRQLQTVATETGEYKMEITITPNNFKQAAKFTDEIPPNFIAEVADAHDAVVTIENNKIVFYWEKLPDVNKFKISYFARSGEPGPAPVINGYFTFDNLTNEKQEPQQISMNEVSPVESKINSTDVNQNAEASTNISKEPMASLNSKPVSKISNSVNSGISYRVQVSATQKSPAKDNKWFHSKYHIDTDIEMTYHEGWKKYLTGNFTTLDEAASFKNKTKENIPDAFIVAYENGVRITLEEAKRNKTINQ